MPHDSGVEVSVVGKATVSANLSSGTELWAIWGYIAIEQARLAQEARTTWVAQRAADESWDMNTELQPAMIAIAAAATSLDGFEQVVRKEGVPVSAPQGNDPSRAQWIWETLRKAFNVNPHTNRWPGAIKYLFALRNTTGGGLLHPTTVFGDPSDAHPIVTGLTLARTIYTTETADNAVGLMREIYAECRVSTRPEYPALALRMEGLNALLLKLTETDA